MRLRERVRSLERKATQKGVAVGPSKVYAVVPPEKNGSLESWYETLHFARLRARGNIVATYERKLGETGTQFFARVDEESERASREVREAFFFLHFGATLEDADIFYSFD